MAFAADGNNTVNKWFHKTGVVLAVATPLAFLLPSSLVLPIDVTLGVLFPLHSHVALNTVITDYVPKSARNHARIALLAVTIAASLFTDTANALVVNAFFGVLRQAMATDPLEPAGVYFGTSTGTLFASADEGDSWRPIAQYLPTISSVETLIVDA